MRVGGGERGARGAEVGFACETRLWDGRACFHLGLNHGERGHGAALHGLGHLGGTLEQARVEVEDVAGVCLASGRAAEEQRHLAVRDGLGARREGVNRGGEGVNGKGRE